MYATVIQSLTSEGTTRQTAIAVSASQGIVTYSRIAGGRGRAGAWQTGYPEDLATSGKDEQVLGMPSSVRVTESDEQGIADGKPTVLWQKLARVAASEDFPTTGSLDATYARIFHEAEMDPRLLATYLGGSGDAPKHIVDALRAPEQAAQPAPQAVEVDGTVVATVEHHDVTDLPSADIGFMGISSDEEPEPVGTIDRVVGRTENGGIIAAISVPDAEPDDEDDTPLAFESDATESEMFEDDEEDTALWDSLDELEERVAEPDPKLVEAVRDALGTPEMTERIAEAVAQQPEEPEHFITTEVHTTDEAEAPLMTPQVVGAGGHVPQRSELAPLIVPSLKDTESYVERTLPGGKSEAEVFDFAREHGHAVAIFGHSGTGKTSSARNYAAQRQLPFVPFECNPQTDEEVVQGTYIPTGNGTELAWRYSQLATAIQRPSVILLNESNRMSAKANALFLHLLQERELIVSRHKNEVIPVHPGVLFITDANPGYQGTTKHDQAFLDRFAITLEFEYDREVEKHFIPSTHLLDLATQLREQAEREDRYRDTPVSTRLLINFVEHAKGLGMEFAIASFLASFATDERDALRMVVDVYATRIAEDLGLAEQADDDEDDRSFAFDREEEMVF